MKIKKSNSDLLIMLKMQQFSCFRIFQSVANPDLCVFDFPHKFLIKKKDTQNVLSVSFVFIKDRYYKIKQSTTSTFI